jgi:prevent-host-death family protein
MTVATITQLKNQLSAYIDRVRAGETILVVDRGVPVARLEPAANSESDDGRVERLERAGLLRRGRGRISSELLRGPLPRSKRSVVDALLEERREGR